MTTFLALGGGEVPYVGEAYHYHDADTAWQAGANYRRRYANEHFTYDVVNVDDPEERVT